MTNDDLVSEIHKLKASLQEQLTLVQRYISTIDILKDKFKAIDDLSKRMSEYDDKIGKIDDHIADIIHLIHTHQ